MKSLMTTCCTLLVGVLLGADTSSGTSTNSAASASAATNGVEVLTPAMRKARARAKMYQRTGGWVRKPGTGRGKCVFVNTQQKIPAAPIAQAAADISKLIRVDVECVEGKPVTVQTASMGVLMSGGQAAVFIVDDAALPPLLVAPESRWAMVNAAALTADKASDATIASRTIRECNRAFAQLLGASNSSVPAGCVLRPVNSLRDLDALTVDGFCPEPIERILEHLETLGVKPYVASIYRTACIQGWAPPPTNDVQKAIWDKAHAVPANPMKIEFDPKKGR